MLLGAAKRTIAGYSRRHPGLVAGWPVRPVILGRRLAELLRHPGAAEGGTRDPFLLLIVQLGAPAQGSLAACGRRMQKLSRPSGASSFLLFAQEKRNHKCVWNAFEQPKVGPKGGGQDAQSKEKSTPFPRFAGVLPAKSAPVCGVFRRHIPVPSKNAPTSCRRPFGHGALPVLRTDTVPAASLCRSTGASEQRRTSCPRELRARSARALGAQASTANGRCPRSSRYNARIPESRATRRKEKHDQQTHSRQCPRRAMAR